MSFSSKIISVFVILPQVVVRIGRKVNLLIPIAADYVIQIRVGRE